MLERGSSNTLLKLLLMRLNESYVGGGVELVAFDRPWSIPLAEFVHERSN